MEAALDRHIEINPEVRGGAPRLAGTRITVADIVIMRLRLGQTLEEIAAKYELSLAAVYAAMAYYYDYQAVIDQGIKENVALGESLRSLYPSRL
jgi:uncharacterized protein (DUF433 family)